MGSLLLGNTEFIRKARRVRKVFGGGMRQAGVLAAAGLFALKNNVARLKEDHRKARLIGEELQSKSFVKAVLPVYSNIVIFHLNKELINGEAFEAKLREQGIRVSAFGKDTIRMVTHLDFSDGMLNKTMEVLKGL